jgi:pectate lyase
MSALDVFLLRLCSSLASAAALICIHSQHAIALDLEELVGKPVGETCREAEPLRVEGGRVVGSLLPAMIDGYAAGTTGGLGHRLLLVTSDRDDHAAKDGRPSPRFPAESGTVRWAVETAQREGGGWIRFGDALNGKEIRLAAALRPGPNTSIDGGCSGVRLVAKAGITLLTVSAPNVIVAGLSMEKDHYQDGADQERTGDAISVNQDFDRVAILHNSFRRCGDGCIDIVRRDRSGVTARVTVAFNRFEDHNKVMLVGTLTCSIDAKSPGCEAGHKPYSGDALKPEIFVTLQANLFVRTSQRNPKVVSNALIEMVNNLVVLKSLPYADGRRSALYGAMASGGGILMARDNLFSAVDQGQYLAAGPIAALSPRAMASDGPGFAKLDGNVTMDNVRMAQSPALPEWVPSMKPVQTIKISKDDILPFVNCLRRIAGPQGLGLAWPQSCR